jgi:hypothetical protein
MEAKARNRIYYRTNSRWNDLGAFVTYQTIMRELDKSLPNLQPLFESDFDAVVNYAPSEDLTGLLGLQGTILEQELNLSISALSCDSYSLGAASAFSLLRPAMV